jgi:nitrite reductase (NAD(P)H)
VEVLTNCYPTGQLVTTTSTTTAEPGTVTEQTISAFAGLELSTGQTIAADLVIYAIGISPRDEIARVSGLTVNADEGSGGVVVNDLLETSEKNVFAIGECASWEGRFYGLIGPGGECSAFSIFQNLPLCHLLVCDFLVECLTVRLTYP